MFWVPLCIFSYLFFRKMKCTKAKTNKWLVYYIIVILIEIMFNISLQVFLSAVWIKTKHLIWLLSQWKIITDSENLFFCHVLLGRNLRVKLRGWCVWAEHGPIRYQTARKWRSLISRDSHRLRPNLDKNIILHLATFFKFQYMRSI